MNDGKVNVFSPDMIKNFSEILDQVPSEGSVLIAGREGMFSAGFDLKVMMSVQKMRLIWLKVVLTYY